MEFIDIRLRIFEVLCILGGGVLMWMILECVGLGRKARNGSGIVS